MLEQLPLVWKNGKSQSPTLPLQKIKGGATDVERRSVVKSLQDGVDCGVLYYLTQEEKYAKCGADILFTFIEALKQLEVRKDGGMNSGWMFPTNHLYEARVIGAQIPIIYDFVYSYLKQGGKVYDLGSSGLVDFNFDDAQETFKTYIWLALNRGLLPSNWPVLESSSLVHNTLALDDRKERAKYLTYYTHTDTQNQASLKTVYRMFENEGDIWPESLGYSRHVAAYSIYLMTLLDRYDPSLNLGDKYPNIPAAFMSYYDLQFPNEKYPFFGDGHRNYKVEYSALEMSYLLGKLNKNHKLVTNFGNYLVSSLNKGDYDRGHLHKRVYGAAPYYVPTQLLWYSKKIESSADVDVDPPRPRTKRLEFAGINIQRNISTANPVKNSLMAFLGGGSYIHGHASGIDMELYGQGHVLGVTAGKSKYRTDIHENYYRIFAGHNTVISNGASGSKGDWINLGIDNVQAVDAEPSYYTDGVSPKHSFSISSFYDEHNLVAPAHHQRTMALIKLSETQGYYLDIFQAKSNADEQFHDYVYHNVGDSVNFTSSGIELPLNEDSNRYKASNSLEWKLQSKYKHPGWHYFQEVHSSGVIQKPIEALFTAAKLSDKKIFMRAMMPADNGIEITKVSAPPSYGVGKAYHKKTTPTFILRRQGDAWKNPFTVVYESKTEGDDFTVQSVERINANDKFKGVKVTVSVAGKCLTQVILLQDNIDDVYQGENTGIYFKGRFGLITLDDDGNVREMYVGRGSKLSIGNTSLTANNAKSSAYQSF
ncbi:hypothetical protein [Alteromonas sp. LTR]|uniref:hypothetical protein n=1 Tax=Alteromonas sp. LTR TaxID=1538096 RepID=UPI001268730F|nr:hypothetical protein [Alteromonas sp. LTR]